MPETVWLTKNIIKTNQATTKKKEITQAFLTETHIHRQKLTLTNRNKLIVNEECMRPLNTKQMKQNKNKKHAVESKKSIGK